MKRDFLAFSDLAPSEVMPVLQRAISLKSGKKSNALAGRSAALIFEKPSLRTKASFWVGVEELGGRPVYFGPEEVGLGKREPVEDVARMISRVVDLVIIRTFAHSTIEKFAAASSVPVVNALTDAEHPCQALADILTILEHKKSLRGVKVAYVGDGNNVAISMAYAVAFTGGHFVVASPDGYELPAEHLKATQAAAKQAGGSVTQVRDVRAAVKGADVVYTDVWTSMGQEAETAVRKKAFAGYQVNPALMAHAGPQAVFMHDMPAHPGEEVSEGMLTHPSSVVFDQAENRLWAQMGLLDYMFTR